MRERHCLRGHERQRESRSSGKFHNSLIASWATCCLGLVFVLTCILGDPLPSQGRKKEGIAWGEGLIVNIPLPAPEVAQVVGDIAANGIIRGTKEYNRDEFVTGAKAADSAKAFGEWKQGGEVFYKVREEALDPRNFKDSGDLGTLAVRYVVKPQGAKTPSYASMRCSKRRCAARFTNPTVRSKARNIGTFKIISTSSNWSENRMPRLSKSGRRRWRESATVPRRPHPHRVRHLRVTVPA